MDDEIGYGGPPPQVGQGGPDVLPFTQASGLELQKLQNGLSTLRQQVDEGTLAPDEAAPLHQQIMGRIQPLLASKKQSEQAALAEQHRQALQASALNEAVGQQGAVYRALGLGRRVVPFTEPAGGQTAYLYEQQPGKWGQVEFPGPGDGGAVNYFPPAGPEGFEANGGKDFPGGEVPGAAKGSDVALGGQAAKPYAGDAGTGSAKGEGSPGFPGGDATLPAREVRDNLDARGNRAEGWAGAYQDPITGRVVPNAPGTPPDLAAHKDDPAYPWSDAWVRRERAYQGYGPAGGATPSVAQDYVSRWKAAGHAPDQVPAWLLSQAQADRRQQGQPAAAADPARAQWERDWMPYAGGVPTQAQQQVQLWKAAGYAQAPQQLLAQAQADRRQQMTAAGQGAAESVELTPQHREAIRQQALGMAGPMPPPPQAGMSATVQRQMLAAQQAWQGRVNADQRSLTVHAQQQIYGQQQQARGFQNQEKMQQERRQKQADVDKLIGHAGDQMEQEEARWRDANTGAWKDEAAVPAYLKDPDARAAEVERRVRAHLGMRQKFLGGPAAPAAAPDDPSALTGIKDARGAAAGAPQAGARATVERSRQPAQVPPHKWWEIPMDILD